MEDLDCPLMVPLAPAVRAFYEEQREILSGALDLDTRLLREVMVPRRSVFTLGADLTISQALEELAAAGHSRAPVTRRGHLDDVVGVVHWSNVHRGRDAAVSTVVTPALYLPDTLRVIEALRQFKQQRHHLAIVLDEYGAPDDHPINVVDQPVDQVGDEDGAAVGA